MSWIRCLIREEKYINHERECFIHHPSSDIQDREVIYQTRVEVFHQISRHRKVIYQTLGEVFDSISQHRKLIYKTWEKVIHPVSRHGELICQTRVGVLHRWSGILNGEVIYQTRVQTPTSDISNGRGVSNDIQTLESYTSKTDEKFCYIRY